MQKKKLDISCVNRIKYESVDEFSQSIFEGVYQNAHKRVEWIIKENKRILDGETINEFCGEEQLNNVIPFLGERGMGKSSAMLSFALFLKAYDSKSAKAYAFEKSVNEPNFCVLPRIDASMMVKGENVMELILAQMWDQFGDKYEKTVSKEPIYEETKLTFKRVKDSFEVYEKAIYGKERVREMTSVRDLHELAKCMNLRKEFKKLVECYLACMNNQKKSNDYYLVISIDDLDVATEASYEILEQIRLFLMIPHVIVLVTADINRLFLEMNKVFSETHICNINCNENEKNDVRGYVRKYLAKIFPANMRVVMPQLGGFIGVPYVIDIKDCKKIIYDNKKLVDNDFDERRLIFAIIAKSINILYYPMAEGRHLLQKESLRAVVNNLHALEMLMDNEPGSRKEQVYQWLLKELMEYGEGMEMGFSLMVERLPLQNIFSHLFLLQMKKIERESKESATVNNYGDLLKNLRYMEECRDERIARLLANICAVQIARNGVPSDAQGMFFKTNIFSGLLKENLSKETDLMLEKDRTVNSVFYFDVKYNNTEENIKNIIIDNLEVLVTIFKLANVYGLNLWNRNAGDYVQFTTRGLENEKTEHFPSTNEECIGSKESIIRIELERVIKAKASVDNIFFNALNYDKNVQRFCENIYQFFASTYRFEGDKSQDLKEILSDERWKLNQFNMWKKENNVNTIEDFLPFQSVEVMYDLVTKMTDKDVLKELISNNETIKTIQNIDVFIIEELEKVENYIEYDKMGYKRYSKKLEGYFEILALGEIDNEYRTRVDTKEKNIGVETGEN